MNGEYEGPVCTSGLCCTRIQNFGVTIGKYEILKDVNLHIHCGELTCLIGPNGAGKSTLLKAILGQVPHTGELVFLDGRDRIWRKPKIGYVPQKLELDTTSPTSVYDLIASALSDKAVWAFHPKELHNTVLKNLERVNAAHLIGRKLGALSGGELQRVLLSLALNPVPDLLLLDEPVSGIDLAGLKLFYKTVSDLRREYHLSIILVSHDLNLVMKYADRVALLNDTTIQAVGTPEEVFRDKKMAEIFGLDLIDGGEDKA
jgi:zinc transport system ATP-binding protein